MDVQNSGNLLMVKTVYDGKRAFLTFSETMVRQFVTDVENEGGRKRPGRCHFLPVFVVHSKTSFCAHFEAGRPFVFLGAICGPKNSTFLNLLLEVKRFEALQIWVLGPKCESLDAFLSGHPRRLLLAGHKSGPTASNRLLTQKRVIEFWGNTTNLTKIGYKNNLNNWGFWQFLTDNIVLNPSLHYHFHQKTTPN